LELRAARVSLRLRLWGVVSGVEKVKGAPFLVEFGSGHPDTWLDLRAAAHLPELNADTPVNAIIVQAHGSANERSAASEFDFEGTPEYSPAPKAGSQKLDERQITGVSTQELPSRCHLTRIPNAHSIGMRFELW